MSKFNYGNSFNTYDGDLVGVQRITVWKSAREFFPSGATLLPEDYKSVGLKSGEDEVGKIIPAGTPVSVEKPGGKPTFNGEKPIGLTYEDIVLGTDGATVTVVTEGEVLVSRLDAEVTEAQQSYLFGRIKFIKEA